MKNQIEYFDNMLKKVYLESITVEQFYNYYSNLKETILNKSLNNSLQYIFALKQSKIEYKNDVDEELLVYNCKKDLDNVLKFVVEEVLHNNKIDLVNYFETMIINTDNNEISLSDYYNYNEVLDLSILLGKDKIDNFKYANALYNSRVESRKTYNDEIRYSTYQKELSKKINRKR